MAERRCDKCTFFHPYHAYKGQCRRKSPEIVEFEGQMTEDDETVHKYYYGCFPNVDYDWWCGEFVPKRLPRKSPTEAEKEYLEECNEHIQKYGR